jgi:hypothetical protein
MSDIPDEAVEARLVSPNAFDGMKPVPEKVNAAARRISELRVKFVNQWLPGAGQPLTTREVDGLFGASAICAEWCREVYEARDELLAENTRLRAQIEARTHDA